MKDSIWPGAPSAATFMLFYRVKAVHLTSATAKITPAGHRIISKVHLWFYPFELRWAAGHGEPRRRCSGTSSVAFVRVIFVIYFFFPFCPRVLLFSDLFFFLLDYSLRAQVALNCVERQQNGNLCNGGRGGVIGARMHVTKTLMHSCVCCLAGRVYSSGASCETP